MITGNLTEEELRRMQEESPTFAEAYQLYRKGWTLAETDPAAALVLLKEVLPVFHQHNALSIASLCLCVLGKAAMVKGEFTVAEEYYLEGYALAQAVGSVTGTIYNLFYHGILHSTQDHFDDALYAWDKAEELCRQSAQSAKYAIIPDIILNRGTTFINAGRFVEAFVSFTQALTTFRDMGDSGRVANALDSIASIYFTLGDKEKALEMSRAALEMSNDLPVFRLPILTNIAVALCDLERPEEGIPYLEKASAFARQLGDRYYIAFTEKVRAEYFLHQYNFTSAKPLFAASADVFLELGVPRYAAHCLLHLAEIAHQEHEIPLAIELAESAVRQLEAANDPVLWADCFIVLSECHSESGNLASALEMERKHRALMKEWLSLDRRRQFALQEIRWKTHELEREKEQLTILNRTLESDNEKKMQEITLLATNITQKHGVIRKISHEIQQFQRQMLRANLTNNLQKLRKELDAFINDDREWQRFEQRFASLFPDFQQQLLHRFPTLTPAEIRVCLLLKAGLSTKEISTALCISERAVEGHRLSLRKKLDLNRTNSLATFIQSL